MNRLAPTILIVDDDPIDVIILQKVIKNLGPGGKPLTANSVSKAKTFIKDADEKCIDLQILLDLNLRMESGFEVIEYINECNVRKNNKIHILSTSNYHGDKERANELGVDSYLVKPNNMNGYIHMLESILIMD